MSDQTSQGSAGQKSQTIDFSNIIVTGLGMSGSFPLNGPGGSAIAPDYAFMGANSDTGMYLAGPGSLGFTVDGGNVVTFSGSNANFGIKIRCIDIGVANSIPATVPGAVQNKIEIFDENGVSLGFLAVYDGIA